MTRDEINTYCAALPGTLCEESFGPGHDVWKIGGKMFAINGASDVGTTLKCPDPALADLLIETERALPAPYLKRGGWVLVPFGTMERDELEERLKSAYKTVRSGLTKKLQAELPVMDD